MAKKGKSNNPEKYNPEDFDIGEMPTSDIESRNAPRDIDPEDEPMGSALGTDFLRKLATGGALWDVPSSSKKGESERPLAKNRVTAEKVLRQTPDVIYGPKGAQRIKLARATGGRVAAEEQKQEELKAREAILERSRLRRAQIAERRPRRVSEPSKTEGLINKLAEQMGVRPSAISMKTHSEPYPEGKEAEDYDLRKAGWDYAQPIPEHPGLPPVPPMQPRRGASDADVAAYNAAFTKHNKELITYNANLDRWNHYSALNRAAIQRGEVSTPPQTQTFHVRHKGVEHVFVREGDAFKKVGLQVKDTGGALRSFRRSGEGWVEVGTPREHLNEGRRGASVTDVFATVTDPYKKEADAPAVVTEREVRDRRAPRGVRTEYDVDVEATTRRRRIVFKTQGAFRLKRAGQRRDELVNKYDYLSNPSLEKYNPIQFEDPEEKQQWITQLGESALKEEKAIISNPTFKKRVPIEGERAAKAEQEAEFGRMMAQPVTPHVTRNKPVRLPSVSTPGVERIEDPETGFSRLATNMFSSGIQPSDRVRSGLVSGQPWDVSRFNAEAHGVPLHSFVKHYSEWQKSQSNPNAPKVPNPLEMFANPPSQEYLKAMDIARTHGVQAHHFAAQVLAHASGQPVENPVEKFGGMERKSVRNTIPPRWVDLTTGSFTPTVPGGGAVNPSWKVGSQEEASKLGEMYSEGTPISLSEPTWQESIQRQMRNRTAVPLPALRVQDFPEYKALEGSTSQESIKLRQHIGATAKTTFPSSWSMGSRMPMLDDTSFGGRMKGIRALGEQFVSHVSSLPENERNRIMMEMAPVNIESGRAAAMLQEQARSSGEERAARMQQQQQEWNANPPQKAVPGRYYNNSRFKVWSETRPEWYKGD